jgi:hypothetical protein
MKKKNKAGKYSDYLGQVKTLMAVACRAICVLEGATTWGVQIVGDITHLPLIGGGSVRTRQERSACQ